MKTWKIIYTTADEKQLVTFFAWASSSEEAFKDLYKETTNRIGRIIDIKAVAE